MKPYFFPYLFVPDEIHEKMLTAFGGYKLIKPLNHDLKKGVEYLDNLNSFENEISSFISEYRYLCESNPGIPKENLKFMKDNIYFKDNLSRSSIRSEIEGLKENNKKDPVLNSAIFLQLSYDSDKSDYNINNELIHIIKNENKLFDELKNSKEDKNISFNSNVSRIGERIQAWITLMNYEFDSNIFITDNEVFSIISEDNDFEPVFYDNFSHIENFLDYSYLQTLTPIKIDNTNIANNILILYKIKKSPENLFEGFISNLPQSVINTYDSTFVGIIS